MSLNPLNALKRRLEDDSTPLSKRFCLARNVVLSHHFPTAPKERVVADWLDRLLEKDKLTGKELQALIGWLKDAEDVTAELKGRLIQIVSQYLRRNSLRSDDVPHFIAFLENGKIASQLIQHIDDYLSIAITILQHLQSPDKKHDDSVQQLSQKVLSNITKFYKECKKKLEFVVKLVNGHNLETIFSYLDTLRDTVVDLCQNILFPINKKSFFVSFLQTMLRKESVDDLVLEKSDNIQSVLVTMKAFFTFPKNRSSKDHKFLSDFIDMFVSCFRNEGQLIFAFYIMVTNSLLMDQSYMSLATKIPPITFEENDDKVKRTIFLKMLETLRRNEVDISVRLSDSFGEKISKAETKKNFTSFLQTVMIGQLNLESKLDKITLQIVKTAMKLDPILIEQKIEQILPPIMAAKKHNQHIVESYTEMMNCLLEILFKLGRGISFISQILPHVKICLEACNTMQFELKQQLKEHVESGNECDKIKSKIIVGSDIFPQRCVEVFGKWTSELLFRQNKELLISLQKDFEEHCLLMLEAGYASPSIITLGSVLAAILSSMLHHNKMADHSAPLHIAHEFWTCFEQFQTECLRKFGECVLKLSYDPQLTISFLQLCVSCSHLKLLNMRYSHAKLSSSQDTHSSSVSDLTALLPCLDSQQWMEITGKVKEDDAFILLNQLLLAKTIMIDLKASHNPDIDQLQDISTTKSHLIKQISGNPVIIEDNGFARTLFWDLDDQQFKQLAKILVKLFLNNSEWIIFSTDYISNNRSLLNAVVLETAKVITKSFENLDRLSKVMGKGSFDFTAFAKESSMKELFESIALNDNQDSSLTNCIDIFKQIPLHALEENYQLVAIFLLLAIKKCCQAKKLKKNIDHILQSTFELSAKHPDLYKVFPLEYIFFDDSNLVPLLTLKIKTSNNMLVIRSVLETAVKKVKNDTEIVRNIVQTLLSEQAHRSNEDSSIQYFSNPAFQISCMLLPLIAKERKVITNSAYRTILANLQEKLHKSILDCFKNIEYSNSNLMINPDGNTDVGLVECENYQATLTAMVAYSLTLSKYCETNDLEEMKNLEYLWPGLEFFVNTAICSMETSKSQNLEYSLQLLNVALRHTKRLETHPVFQDKGLFTRIWNTLVARLLGAFEQDKRSEWLDEMSVTLKFVCELASVELFNAHFIADLDRLTALKASPQVQKEESPSTLTSHKVGKYLWTQCLKANLLAPKSAALSRLLLKMCKTTRHWFQQHCEKQDGVKRIQRNVSFDEDIQNDVKLFTVDDTVCEILRNDLEIVAEAVLAAKKISLDYKCLDCIFELQHMLHYIVGRTATGIGCEVTWQSFCRLFDGGLAILNNLLVSREELLEDRWPCYMQCYRALVNSLCERATSGATDEKLGEIAHKIEKLTQSITKRKTHVSRIAAYTVADLCSNLERNAPSKIVRQHLENSAALLIQASDSSYSAAFLRRALVGLPGHITMTNMYTMYKRYHKYVGNS